MVTLVTNKGSTSVVCADIDGDNDLDVPANTYNTNKIACYKNTNGNFSESQYISETAGGVNALIIADLNGVAAINIAAACEISDMLIWFAN